MVYDVAIVGTGENPEETSKDGYAMAYRHAPGYQRLDNCNVVACADIVPENAEAFAEHFDVDHVFEDHEEMLSAVEPDIVSVCVPPGVHADIVCDCAESGVVQAIHCEKPMAKTWADCQRMADTCREHGVQLTIDHQRRFGDPFRKAKSLLEDGEIGDLERIEFSEVNLFDAGSHVFDLCGYYTNQKPVEWVLAQVDYHEENIWFGAHNENQALAQWRYENGVYGLASTGEGSDFIGSYVRLIGSDGAIEIGVEDGPTMRMRQGGSWQSIDVGDTIHGPGTRLVDEVAAKIPFGQKLVPSQTTFYERAIEDLVGALETGREPELTASNALQATELVFACWESARQRGRVELPLEIEDNPLESMVESGDLQPAPAE